MLLWPWYTVRAQGRQGEADDARAQRLIDEVVKAYKGFPAYVDHGQQTHVTRYRGKQHTKTSPVSLAFARPNRLALRSATTELVCDGKLLSIAWTPFRRYVEITAPESIAFFTFTHRMDEVTNTVALSDDQMHFPLVMALLSGSAREARILPASDKGWVVEPDRSLDGKMLHSLLHTRPIDVDMQGGTRLLIDPDTKLVRKIQEFPRLTPEDLAQIDKQEPALRWDIENSWTASNIETRAAAAELFTYRPAQNFTRVGNFKYASLIEKSMFSKSPGVLPGSPAPDFALNVVDSTGSTRKVSKAELAGKIVVIAYWSISDEPCFPELREIQKIVQKADAGDRVILIALNVDEDPDDIKALCARVRHSLAEKKVELELESPRGCLLAVDPSGVISDLLPVAGLPAVVVLDGKGIVQTFDTGTGEELRGGLPREIETLLAGKPLETPELKALGGFDADESRPTFLIEEPAAFKKIEELGGIVIRAGGESPSLAEIDIKLDEKGPVDELLPKVAPHLKQIGKISRLHLQNTRVTDAGLEALKGMSNIVSVSLEGTSISDRGLESLKTITSLTYVILTRTRVTEDGVLALIRAVPGLRVNYSPGGRGGSPGPGEGGR
jgi:thiol-disulfide isomerase/thioredoxin